MNRRPGRVAQTAVLLLSAALAGSTAAAQGREIGERGSSGIEGYPKGLGLGVALGDPSGIAVSHRPGDWTLFQGTVGWSLTKGRLHLSGDYVRNILLLEAAETPALRYPVYIGIGGRVLLADQSEVKRNETSADRRSNVGVRFPVGIGLLPDTQAIDAFLEVAPVLRLLPDVGVGWDAAIGFRVYPWGRGPIRDR